MTDTSAKPADAPIFTVTESRSGYAHHTIQGTYVGKATAADVAKRFYHPYFGGRGAWARDGKFGCTVHDD